MHSSFYTTMPFGKHRDKLLCDVPSGYLTWLANQSIEPWLFEAVLAELHRRGATKAPPPPPPPRLPDLRPVADQWRRVLSREFHPDMGGSHDGMKAVNRGYDLLLELFSAVGAEKR